ncbi:putative glycine--tRNA ligase [Neolecta irregularis DAH-3]|uniref:glycine--tRNA ligase n=1 Tax=Neolecta irregularis (strain DAH-3) TaxID=1198029 RepID=A0A1U7LWD2_NEOID|nr:putative glycine--tRNA ligase [Neolecta irregularis DAH-3]|eukprot:OLL26928.1 putative glycine--tRNA ligase [Neolecta irregularis DAH-3]
MRRVLYLARSRTYQKMTARPARPVFDKEQLDSLLSRRFFVAPGFEIYAGVAGLYDYGPPACALQANIVDQWRKHFVLEEDMLEIDTTIITPAEVLKTSGHVERFADWMCKDPASGEIFRADHLIEQVLEARLKGDKEARGESVHESPDDTKKRKAKVKPLKLDNAVKSEYEQILAKIDGYSGKEMGELIVQYSIRNPVTDKPLEAPQEFNLMFDTSIGPTGAIKGYLRPETAQGQFLNFSRLLEFNNNRMPFASAQIGKSFRNEISPRSGLLRVREFLMAEIEHYVDPETKSHARFNEVKDVKLCFLPKDTQEAGKTDITELTIGQAVEMGIVDNTTLGYFLVRIHQFLVKIGITASKLRFRQHMKNEMAHYACDCWDAELQTSYGWIECVGCADRSAYDLTVHSKKTNRKLVVRENLEQPRVYHEWEGQINKKVLGPKFKKDAKAVEERLLAMTQEEMERASQTGSVSFDINGQTFTLNSEFVTFIKVTRKESVREYTPNVIEPSFGIGRILYSLIEHSYWSRPEDSQRGVLSFPPIIAPIKCLLVPLSGSPEFIPIVKHWAATLRNIGISNKVDDSSANIGRRYARNDELGTPFGITIDFQTVKDKTVTLRERDSTTQIRASEIDICQVLQDLTGGKVTWEQVVQKYGEFQGQSLD